METVTDGEGQTFYVATDEGDGVSRGPFYVAYRDRDRERRYGWVCGVCDSLDAMMDTMGRVECRNCGNQRKPTEWDAAHE